MSAAALIAVGAVLCFFGAWSARIGVLAAGFGAGWLLAEAFEATLSTALLVAAGGAATAFVVTLLVAKFLFFVAGACVGAIVGAKVFVLTGSGEPDWLLALVLVPSVALVSGFLADHFHRRFLAWGTALAGAALLLSGIGRLGASSTDDLWRPESAAGSAVLAALWLGLTLVGHRTQAQHHRRERRGGSPAP